MITYTIVLLSVFIVLALILLSAKDDWDEDQNLPCAGPCQQGRLACPDHCPRKPK